MTSPAIARGTSGSVPVLHVDAAGRRARTDHLATEEPLEIRVGGPGQTPTSAAVTMRTPGHDFELAVGFLSSEGLIGPDDVQTVRYCVRPEDGGQEHNIVTVDLVRPVDVERLTRRFAATAACGVCGKATLDDLAVRCQPVAAGPTIPASVLVGLPDTLRTQQQVFDRTGGLHAAGAFRPDGTLELVREDVGRHNAVDKIIGRALLDAQLPLSESVLMVSGRLGFEIIQKAAVAGIPIIAAVSAPSTLAVQTAVQFDMTVVGFLRGETFNVYSGAERIALDR